LSFDILIQRTEDIVESTIML